ncbi:hypothetical protein E2C01_087118 [Portunus trituberculatus]|uniref:Uncharacterized protein n=1 Tax=Portunus trituberculatus TaxID=210409 RepID=A0A5B7JFB0_PORTR|nr:hypothetical protein [Portunus trituberculatus]
MIYWSPSGAAEGRGRSLRRLASVIQVSTMKKEHRTRGCVARWR